MEGHILLHRKIIENAIFFKPEYLQVWIYILIRVNHKEKEMIWNGQKKLITIGSGIFSQLKISQDLGISIGTVNNILKYLKSENQIEIKSTSKFTEIQVIMWSQYQCIESIIENRMKTKRKQNETNKHDKHEEQIVYPNFEEVEKYFKDHGFSSALAKKAFTHYDELGWKDSNKKTVKNWKAKMDKVWFTEKNAGFKQKVNGANGAIV